MAMIHDGNNNNNNTENTITMNTIKKKRMRLISSGSTDEAMRQESESEVEFT